MPDPRGFMKHERRDPSKRPVEERVGDFAEVEQPMPPPQLEEQAARCMDCGIPFCHMYGCPVRNVIPEWNEMVFRGYWQQALAGIPGDTTSRALAGLTGDDDRVVALTASYLLTLRSAPDGR